MKQFFRVIVALAAVLIFSSICTAQDTYRVIFLSDTHYDAADEKLHPAGVSKARPRDTEMWKERLPKLLTAANQTAGKEAVFVLQAGDLVEGYGGTADAHKNMLEAGYKKVQSYFSVPLLTTAGNHDISSKVLPGERHALHFYKDFAQNQVLTAIKNIKGVSDIQISKNKTDFAFRYGKDLFLILDFNRAGTPPDFLKKVLTQHADARYKIILTHAGPIPWDVKWAPNWRLYGNPACAESRKGMVELFQQHNCIFLTGHYHAIASLEYTTEKGTIHQIQGSCVWTPDIADQLHISRTNPDDYGKYLLQSSYLKKPGEKQQLIDRFKPGLKSYFYAGGAGYMILDINDQNITINYYHRDQNTPSKTFVIPAK